MTEPEPSLCPVLVIGDGVAGRATARALAQSGVSVTVLGSEPGEGSASAARPDGMDAALGDDDDPARHAADLIELAGPDADRAAIEALTRAAPGLFERMSRLGVPFERGRDGKATLAKLRGASRARTAHASSLTARHVSRRLGAELRGLEVECRTGLDLVALVQDDAGCVVGVVVRQRSDGEISSLRADAVCLASGGFAGLFATRERGARALGGALGVALRAGAELVHAERVSFGLGYRAAGFVRTLPERLVAQGEHDAEAGLLDLSSAQRAELRVVAGPALAVYEESTGRDAFSEPIAVVSTPLFTLGGLGVGFDDTADSPKSHATTLEGLWAAGGAAGLYRGRESTRGAPLTEALFGAGRAAQAIRAWRAGLSRSASALDDALFQRAADAQRERFARLFERASSSRSDDTPFSLLDELRAAVAERRKGALGELHERLGRARIDDREPRANASLALLGELHDVWPLAERAAS